ncbi:MAG: anti-sigma factor [Novosphingobium sp.]
MTERDQLAAEFALGLLEGEELLAARGLAASDRGFAELVARWQEWLAPLLDTIAPVEPDAALWHRIAEAIAAPASAEVVRLRRVVRVWQLGTAMAAAAALVLALFVTLPGQGPGPQPAATQRAAAPAPLAVALAPQGGGTLSLVYLPGERRLVALAGALPARKGHDLELWLLPEGGKPLSLGLVAPGATRRLAIPPALAAQLGDGSAIAISLEPMGGSPTGQPTGPVLASGKVAPV